MPSLIDLLKKINEIIWSAPLLIILLGTHLYFTFHLKFVQKKLGKAIRYSVSAPERSKETDSHSISGFSALTTTLAATLGTGNIVGVSAAIAVGGPGAVFWCWLTGIFGMATTYAECFLGIKYRKKQADGSIIGGPMIALEVGVGSKPLAILFCLATLFASYGMGCSTQARSVTQAFSSKWGLPPSLVGIVLALLVGFAIVGGIRSISRICMKLVPAMGGFYLLGCIIILIMNHSFLPEALITILSAAFKPSSIAGGFIGGTFLTAARFGISRGLFTNEAGIGSAALAAADVEDSTPTRQALVSMTATFWDTVVMCAITGLVIISSILKNPDSIIGYSMNELTTAAFAGLPVAGTTILTISLFAFALATLIGWSYFGEKAANYLFGKKGINIYRLGYILMVYFGSILSLDLIWEMSDLANALMAIPNLIALFLLRKEIK